MVLLLTLFLKPYVDKTPFNLRSYLSRWLSNQAEKHFKNTVRPLLSGPAWDLENWPLNRSWPFNRGMIKIE